MGGVFGLAMVYMAIHLVVSLVVLIIAKTWLYNKIARRVNA
jgi:uncharacterized membrane protein